MDEEKKALEVNKEIVRRFLIDIYSTGKLELVGEVCGNDYVWHGEAGPTEKNEVRGLENFKEALADFKNALPDAKVTIEDMIAEGDKVVVRITETGTHTGAPFAGVPPRGKRISWTGISIYRIANGKLVEEWFNEDSLSIMQQLSAL